MRRSSLRPAWSTARRSTRQRGVTTVEFALCFALVFMPLMFGIVDFGRWLFAFSSAAEATRYGARIATVCDPQAAGVKARMLNFLPGGTSPASIRIFYDRAAGTVNVSLTDVAIPAFSFFLQRRLPLPAVSTTLPAESLQTTPAPGAGANALCSAA